MSRLSAVRHNVANSMGKIVHSYKDFNFLNHLNMFMEDAIQESGGGIFPKEEDIFVKIWRYSRQENKECFYYVYGSFS